MNERHAASQFRLPALSPAALLTVRLFALLPFLCLLIATAVYFGVLGRLIRANLAPIVAAETSRQIHHDIRLGAVSLSPSVLVLHNVAVSSRKTWQSSHGEAAVSADRVTIHYSLHDLLFHSGEAAHAIGDVVLDRPVALVERLNARTYNFTDLLTPRKKKPGRPFDGQIIVNNGTLTFRDYVAPARVHERPAVNRLYGINTAVSFHSERYVYFDGAGQGRSARLGNVAIRGDASRMKAGRYRVFARVSDGDAAYWSDYFKAFPQGRILAGRANLDLTISQLDKKRDPMSPLDLLGRVNFSQVSVALTDPRVSRLPLERISGSAIFTGAGVTADGQGFAAGQPVTVHGSVFDLQHPQLAFNASSSNFDPNPLIRDLPRLRLSPGVTVSSGASATAQITGSSTSPVVSADARFPAAAYRGNTARNIRARILYANNVLSLPQVLFVLAGGGQGVVRATINTETRVPTVLLGGRVANVNLANLRLPQGAGTGKVAIGGYANASFLTTQGTGKADPQYFTVANVTVSHPRLGQTVLRSAHGRVAWMQGQDVTIRRAIVEDMQGGVASVSGRVPALPHSTWNLAVDATGASLAALAAPYSTVPISGLAYAQARVVGPLDAPQVTGTGQIYGGRFNHIGIDAVTGNIAASRDGLTLKNVVMRRYPTEAHVSGTITRLSTGNPVLALKIAFAQGDVQDFLSLAREVQSTGGHGAIGSLPTLTGTAQGTFRVSGRAQSPQIVGHAAVTDATIDAYRLEKVRADIAYGNGNLHVENGLVLGENGASAIGHGQFNQKTGAIAAALDGHGLNVDLFRTLFNPYADLDGMLDFSLQVAGTASSPNASVRVSGTKLAVNGQSLSPLTVAGTYRDGVFAKTAEPWTIAVLPNALDAEGVLLSPQPAPVDYVIDNLRIVLPTAAHPKSPRAINIAAHIPEEAPERISHLVETIRGSVFASQPGVQKALATIDALPAAPEGTLYVPSLTVEGTAAAPRISATIDARRVTVGSENGAGQVEVVGSYTGGAKPAAQARVQATDLHASGVSIQTLSADGGLQDRIVTLRTLDAHNQAADVHAAGHADLDGDITATLDASNVPLALFNGLIPAVKNHPAPRLSGTLGALTVEASGKTSSPDLIGSVNLDRPVLDLNASGSGASRYALDSVRTGTVKLTSSNANGTRLLTINDLAAFKGGRPVATLSGTLPLNLNNAASLLAMETTMPLHAELKIADLSVLTLFSPSLIDPARTGGSLTAMVDMGSGQQSLRGRVDIAGASVGLTGFDTALTKVGGSILLNGERVTVQGLSGQSNRGGAVSVIGGGTLIQANLRMRADRFAIDETGHSTFLAQTYNSGAKGRLDGLVTFSGPWLSPHVATLAGAPLILSGASGIVPSVTPPAGRIAQVNIVRAGTETVPQARILSVLTQKVGESFDPSAAQHDLSALRNLGYFNGGVKLSTERDSTGGIVVTYTVAESAVRTFDPQFDIAVALGGAKSETVTVRSSLLQAQARGDLHLGGTLLSPTLKAHLTVAHGQLILPPSTLLRIIKPREGSDNIVDARYGFSDTLTDGQQDLETRVNLTAQANVTVSPELLSANVSAASSGLSSVGQLETQNLTNSFNSFGSGGQQRYKITAHISGLLNVPNRLNLELTSSPPGLTHQQMLAALVQEDVYLRLARGGAGAEDAVKAQLGAAFSTIAIPTLLSPLEESIANTFGLEDFSVDYSPNSPVLVTLSKQLAARLTATYSRAFGARAPGTVNSVLAPPQYTLKLGYEFTNHFQFSISTDDQRNNTAALEGVYGF